MVQVFLRRVARFGIVVILSVVFQLVGPSVFGQTANPFFVAPTFTGSGEALTADVNGDGKPDLLFLDGTVLLGKGDGTFTSGTSWRPSGTLSVNQFAIADFNGDGKTDILIAAPFEALSVLLGNGDGTFQAPVTTALGQPGGSFVVGDFNNDGRADVIVMIGTSVLTLLGKSDGTFDTSGIVSNVQNPAFAYVADFNEDGKLDLLITGSGVQLGNGDGTFQAVTLFPSGALSGTALVGDFDGDGHLDVAATDSTSTSPLQVLFGNGDGTFRAAAPQSLSTNAGIANLVAVDLNGDGKADIVGSTGFSAVQTFISKGDGTFTLGEYFNAPYNPGGGGASNMVVGDFNGDKKNDVAAFNTMLLGNGDGTLQGNQAFPGTFFQTMGDFNGDGHPDFAFIGPVTASPTDGTVIEANLDIWLNDGKNNFTLAHTYPIILPFPDFEDIFGYVGISVAADFNGDGKIDLAGYIWDAGGLRMIVLLGNGDGSFGAPIGSSVNSAGDRLVHESFTFADLNGDGKPDFLVNAGEDQAPNVFSILLNNGDGSFGTPITPFTDDSIGGIAFGDFNNDKKLDMIAATANGLGVFLGKGDGTFQAPTTISNSACGTSCGGFVSGDFDGDGNVDLIVPAAKGYQVLLGKGDGTFTLSPVVAISAGMFSAGQVADFNGDGQLDVLGSVGSPNSSPAVMLGNGDGTFGSPFAITNAGAIFVADFNGDKKLDILEAGANQLAVLLNGSGPTFAMTAGTGSSVTITAGKTASYSLSLSASGGFSGSVALTCSGAPADAVCSIMPASVSLSGATPVTAMVSITTKGASQLLPAPGNDLPDSDPRMFWILGLFFGVAGVRGAVAFARRTRRRYSYSFAAACGVVALIAASVIAGCGGSGSASNMGSNPSVTGTPPGSYTITVKATSGADTRTRKLTLVVQ